MLSTRQVFPTKQLVQWLSWFLRHNGSNGMGRDQGQNEVRWRPGQEASLAPPWSNLRSFGTGSKCTAIKKCTCDIVGTFRRPIVIRLPGNWYPLAHALGRDPRKGCEGSKMDRTLAIKTWVVYFQPYRCLSVSVCSAGTWEKSRLLTLKANLSLGTTASAKSRYVVQANSLGSAWSLHKIVSILCRSQNKIDLFLPKLPWKPRGNKCSSRWRKRKIKLEKLTCVLIFLKIV